MSSHLTHAHSLKPSATSSLRPSTDSAKASSQPQGKRPKLEAHLNNSGNSNTSVSQAKEPLRSSAALAERMCLQLCCRLMLPFSIADSDAMFDFLHDYRIVKSRADMPSQLALTTALADLCDTFEDEIKRFVTRCDPQSIATSQDLWTDGNGNNFITLSVHLIDKSWNFQVVNLGTDQLDRPHTTARIESHIEAKLTQFGLEKLINVSVKDNGSKVKVCARNMTAVTGLDPAQFDDFECFGHNLHLLLMRDVIQDSQHDELRALLKKVKAIHLAMSSKLQDLKKRNLEGKEIQDFSVLFEEKIVDILKAEGRDVGSDSESEEIRFKDANDQCGDSIRILLKTRRENEGKLSGRSSFTSC